MIAITSTYRSHNTASEFEPNRLEEIVERRLRESGYQSMSNVVCTYRAGVALLIGQVPSFYSKQVAQAIVNKVTGVDEVRNMLEVVAHGP